MGNPEIDNSDKKRILIIDDSKIVRASIIKHLRDRYLIREAENGEAGWEALLLDPAIQVVICDLQMPVMDGYQLLDKIRSSKVKRIQVIPFIVISGMEENENGQLEAVTRGANDFISKNAGAIEFSTRLESMLELARAQRTLSESRAALAKNAAFDPIMQMATPHFLEMQLDMMWSFARRHKTDIALLCLRIDRQQLGSQAQNHSLFNKLEISIGELLRKTIRQEDCIAHTATGEFNLIAAGITLESAQAFAKRLIDALAKFDLTKFGTAVKLSASIGITSLLHDRPNSIYEFRALVRDRVEAAQIAGGNTILPKTATPQAATEFNSQVMNVEKAIELLNNGKLDRVLPHLDHLRHKLQPLLQLFEQLN